MTGAERAAIRKNANGLATIFQIGKGDIGENMIEAVDAALEQRELIKLSGLDPANISAKEAANALAEATGAEVIQCIGRKLVLYRKKKEQE